MNLPQNNMFFTYFINQGFKRIGSVFIMCSPKKFPGKSKFKNGIKNTLTIPMYECLAEYCHERYNSVNPWVKNFNLCISIDALIPEQFTAKLARLWTMNFQVLELLVVQILNNK